MTNLKYFNLLESLILQVATTKALWCRVCLVHSQPEEVLRARLPLGRCQEVNLQEISIQIGSKLSIHIQSYKCKFGLDALSMV